MKISFATALTLALALSVVESATAAARSNPMLYRNPIVGQQAAQTVRYGGPFLQGARYLGPARLGAFEIQVALRMRNADGLRAYAAAASDPHSFYYRHWLTPPEIADAFGASRADEAAVLKYFRSYGLRASGWKQREVVRVWGAQRAFERALGTRFGIFERFGRRFSAPLREPSVAAGLPLSALLNIVTYPTMHRPLAITQPPQPISGGFSNARVNGLTPYNLGVAYDYFGAWTDGYTGKGINLGIIGTGPIAPAEIAFFRKLYNVPGTGTFTIVPATMGNTAAGNSPGDQPPPPPTDNFQNPCTQPASGTDYTVCNPEDAEAQLDAEQATGLAPDANVLFYLAYNPNELSCAPPVISPIGPSPTACVPGTGSPAIGLTLYEDSLQQAINDNKADILSESFGGCEALNVLFANPSPTGQGIDNTELATLASEGIAVFISSGDSGPQGCQRLLAGAGGEQPSASTNSDDPNAVSVGGTTTPVAPNGRLTGPITVWGVQTKSGGAEGSSQSAIYATPPYQQQFSAMCPMRCQPDIVGNADPFTGANVIGLPTPSKGVSVPIGGTSEAAPDVAAMWALVLQACKQTPSCLGKVKTNPPPGVPPSPAYRLGNPNYQLYALYKTPLYKTAFYDIVYGESAVPSTAAQLSAASGQDPYAAPLDPGATFAGPGFDQATGLGAPFARGLIKAIVGV